MFSILIFAKWFLSLLSLMNSIDGSYTILPESRVYIQGSSNVNHFTCNCNNSFDVQFFKVFQSSEHALRFEDTRIALPVALFDCKNRKMERDLQKALKAEQYPMIDVELNNLKIESSSMDQSIHQPATATADINITLAGVTKTKSVKVKVNKDSSSLLRIEGSQILNMTDYGITPPEVLFGMIKVNDQITFHFNLQIQITKPSL